LIIGFIAGMTISEIIRKAVEKAGRTPENVLAVEVLLAYCLNLEKEDLFMEPGREVSVTEEAMKVVHEAFQLFGGNGTTREYPIEKLFRDTRSALIEDGENYMLTMRLGILASRLYQEGWTRN